MIIRLKETLPDPEDVLRLAPEQLGRIILLLLKEYAPSSRSPKGLWPGLNEFYNPMHHGERPYDPHTEDVYLAVMEAVSWLERVGLIARYAGSNPGDFFFVTRRAWKLETEADLEGYLRGGQLPRDLYHREVIDAALPDFMGGTYDTAVFKAFRVVEIRLRDLTGARDPNVKIDGLMQAAFQKGGLTGLPADVEEQKQLRAWVVEAMRFFRNPAAHNSVTMPAAQAVEAIGLASFIRRLLD